MLNLPLDVNNSDYDQPRYGVNKRCYIGKYSRDTMITEQLDKRKTNVSNEEDQDRFYYFILYGIEVRMNERILIGTFGSNGN